MPRKPKHKRLRNSIHQAGWKEQHALVVELSRDYLAHHPHDATVLLTLAKALVQLSRYEEAERILEDELAPGFEILQCLFWRERGVLERRRGQLELAISWFQRALEADATQDDLRIDLGFLALRLERFEEAENHFRRALEEADFECKGASLFRLGEVLRAQNRIGEAADCFRQAVAFEPKQKIARTRLREAEQVLLLRLSN